MITIGIRSIGRKHAHGRCDVLEMLIAPIMESKRHLAAHFVMNFGGDAYSPRLSDSLQPSRDIYAVAIETFSIFKHVSEIDADAKLKGWLCFGIKFFHLLLD